MSLFHKKKALVLFGSPQGHGHTAQLLESFLECFRRHGGWEVEVADLYRLNPHPAPAARPAPRRSVAPTRIWTPWTSPCGPAICWWWQARCTTSPSPRRVKAWLDRTQRYFEARFALGKKPPIPKHRQAVLLLTMGSQDEFAVKVCTHQLERAFSVMNTTLSAWAVWDATDRGDERKAGAQAAARAIALEILGKM